jgi:hypothetical protein
MVTRIVALSIALCFAVVPTALGNDFGGHVVTGVTSSNCIFSGNLCTIRAQRVDLGVATTWTVGVSDEGISAENQIVFPDSPSGLMQILYAKLGSSVSSFEDCGVNGHARAVLTEYSSPGTGVFHCFWGQSISNGETHTLKVQRCSVSGTWCSYVDGNETGGSPIYLAPNTSSRVYMGEESWDQETSSTMPANFGGSTDWQLSDSGASDPTPTWYTVTDTQACLYRNFGDYSVDSISPGSTWQISKASGKSIHTC